MKKLFTWGLLSSALIFTSCGGEEKQETNEKTKTAANEVKKEYDCECETAIDAWKKGGGRKINSSKGKAKKAILLETKKEFTGTCAEFSNDRAREIIGLYTFENGYRSKSQKWKMVNDKKMKIEDLSFDKEDNSSGYKKEYRVFDKKKNIWYTSAYQEMKDGNQIHSWKIESYKSNDYTAPLYYPIQNGENSKNGYDYARNCYLENWGSKEMDSEKGMLNFLKCISKNSLVGFESNGL